MAFFLPFGIVGGTHEESTRYTQGRLAPGGIASFRIKVFFPRRNSCAPKTLEPLKALGPGYDPRDVFVGQIMSRDATTVSLDESWEECLTKMRKTHCRHLPVVEKGCLIGMISLRDVLGIDDAEMLDSYLWDRDARWEETTTR